MCKFPVTMFYQTAFLNYTAGREPVTKKGSTPVMTVPVTPQLVSRSRSRPQHIPSQQEIEEQEVEEMKRYINSN